MRDKHEPHDGFVERLEWQIAGEVRRRNRPAPVPGWALRSRARLAIAAAALVLVSMGIGGGVVAAAYQAQDNERRDILVANFRQRVDLARQRLDLAAQQARAEEHRMSVGLATPEARFETRVKVAEAETDLKLIALQLEEVRLTGREPLAEISAPLVSGRDFVGERLRIELSLPESMLGLENTRLRDMRTRVEIGVAHPADVHVAEARIEEVRALIESLRKKIDLRQRFLKGEFDAVQADLRVLENEAELRLRSLKPTIELARQDLDRITARVNVGLAAPVELAEVRLRMRELEVQVAKAEVDLLLIRRRLSGK
jgi:outer membrane protein TolC